MTRDHDRDPVCAVCGPDRSDRARISEASSDLTVAHGFSMRYESNLLPHTILEVGPLKTELEVELAARACKILRQLRRHDVTAIAIRGRGFIPVGLKEDPDEAIEAVDDNRERSDLGRYGVLKKLLSHWVRPSRTLRYRARLHFFRFFTDSEAQFRYSLNVTYNFDPERWYKTRLRALEARRDRGELAADRFASELEDLDKRYEEMMDRLDGSYVIPDSTGDRG